MFVGWLYYHELPDADTDWVEYEYQNEITHQWHIAVQIAKVKACALGARLLASTFCRATEQNLIKYMVNGVDEPYYETVIYAFAHLPPSSPVLRAMIDVHCKFFLEQHDKDEHEDWSQLMLREKLPNSFLVGVMLRYAKIKNGTEVELNQCHYHDHTTEEERNHCQEKAL